MTQAATTFYSAAQLARAVGISKRTLLADFKARNLTPRGKLIVHGNPADAWSVADLRDKHQQQVQQAVSNHGTRDVHAFITDAPAPWQPPIPLSEIAPEEITKAEKLRLALHAALSLRNDPAITSQELEARIQRDYQAQFNHTITDRTARALLKRTVERDNFAENWDRLEIYLDGNPKRKGAPAIAIIEDAQDFAELHSIMATFKSLVSPSHAERERLWDAAFKLVKVNADAAQPAKHLRIRLIDFLWRCAPCLAKSKNALRVAFAEKYARWEQGGCNLLALQNKNEARRGVSTGEPIPQELVDLLTYHAAFRAGGRISQGYRELGEVLDGSADPHLQIVLGWIEDDPAIARFLRHDSANKSYVPARLREAVRQDVIGLQDYRLGGRTLNCAYAALERYRDNLPSRYSYSADDVTLPVYFYVPDGEGWFRLVRGQCIIVIDRRTLRILGFSLQPDNNYSSPVIHTAFTRVFADHGVPRKLLLEMGIWKSSKLITGAPQSQTSDHRYKFLPHSWAETETGFGRLGIEISHATRPRTKEVERVIGLVQDLMEGEPGYCGRAERVDLPETVKRQMEDVKYRRVPHPSKYFYSFDQWEARLIQIFEKYNRTPQQGIVLSGMSPDEADEKLQSADESKRPLMFDATCRWLLSQYVVEKEAGRDGITITIGKKTWRYYDTQLARDKWKRVLCWFNPADPSLLVVTDLNMKNPYTVQLATPVDADDPAAPELADAMARSASYNSQTKARFNTLKAKFDPMFRRVHPSRAVVETGQQIRQQQEVIAEQRKQQDARKSRVQRRASELALPSTIINPGADGDEGTALMLQARRNHQKKQQTTTPEKP